MTDLIHLLHRAVWGPWLLAIFLGAGGYLTLRSRGFQIRGFGTWMGETAGKLAASRKPGKSKREEEAGCPSRTGVSQFQTACTALAATVGTGNIVGVATALAAGGPGAVFWMWVSALIGMMTAYGETWLGIRYRASESRWKMDMRPDGYIGKRGETAWPCQDLRAALRAGVSRYGKYGTGQLPGRDRRVYLADAENLVCFDFNNCRRAGHSGRNRENCICGRTADTLVGRNLSDNFSDGTVYLPQTDSRSHTGHYDKSVFAF